MDVPPAGDEVLEALEDLVGVLGDRSRTERILHRADELRERRSAGEAYRDVTSREQRPLIVEMLSDHIDELLRAGARFRRAEAAALYVEGLTMQQIAARFGVTRQRVSVLLREARSEGILEALSGSAGPDEPAPGP